VRLHLEISVSEQSWVDASQQPIPDRRFLRRRLRNHAHNLDCYIRLYERAERQERLQLLFRLVALSNHPKRFAISFELPRSP
jgi:hypothetical protein